MLKYKLHHVFTVHWFDTCGVGLTSVSILDVSVVHCGLTSDYILDVSVVHYKESLMSRVVMSDGRAVWRCNECGKQHYNKSNIVQHVDQHIQGVQYSCQYCERVFKSQGSLNVHITNKHRDEHKKNKSFVLN